MDEAQSNQLYQALLNRMDFLEHKLIRETRSDVDAARVELGELRGALEHPGARA